MGLAWDFMKSLKHENIKLLKQLLSSGFLTDFTTTPIGGVVRFRDARGTPPSP
jgi:hypothetical protein